MNWANRLTLGRLALTILFVLALSSVWTYGRSIALVLFGLAGISDYFDGEIARRYGTVTKFGKLMDPLVDKVMMAAAFVCLVPLGRSAGWRRSWWRMTPHHGAAVARVIEGAVLPAEKLGKHKTSWQIVTVVFSPAAFARELRASGAGGGKSPGAMGATFCFGLRSA
jgi:CDP-diacylglycerol--glycerol-3-phosphate 3-phosphatidyltransferase